MHSVNFSNCFDAFKSLCNVTCKYINCSFLFWQKIWAVPFVNSSFFLLYDWLFARYRRYSNKINCSRSCEQLIAFVSNQIPFVFQFLSAVMLKDYMRALKYCKLSKFINSQKVFPLFPSIATCKCPHRSPLKCFKYEQISKG